MTEGRFRLYKDMVHALQLDLSDIVELDIPQIIKDYLNDVVVALDGINEHQEWDFFFALDRLVDLALIFTNLLNVKFKWFCKYLYLHMCSCPQYTYHRNDLDYIENRLLSDEQILVSDEEMN